MAKINAINTSVEVKTHGFSIAAGKDVKARLDVSGGNITFVAPAQGDYIYTLPAANAILGGAAGDVFQWTSGQITASPSMPYIAEVSITSQAEYKFNAPLVLKYVTDEVDGRWIMATHGIDYQLQYFHGDTLRIELYNSGEYKVNYKGGETSQTNLTDITASPSVPYVQEIPITSESDYKFKAPLVLKYIEDEVDSRWMIATHGVDYQVQYFGADTLRVEVFANGTYKVNY